MNGFDNFDTVVILNLKSARFKWQVIQICTNFITYCFILITYDRSILCIKLYNLMTKNICWL